MYLHWKWMSAMTGSCDCVTIFGSASASYGVGHGDADDLAAGGGQLGDLLERGVDVGGDRGGHRLHADRGAAADEDAADVELAGLPALGEAGGRHGGHAEGQGDGCGRQGGHQLILIGLTMSAPRMKSVSSRKVPATP